MGKDLRVCVRLINRLRIVRPARRHRGIARILKHGRPALPATWQQPESMNKYDWRAAGGVGALNGRADVSREVRERVLSAAHDLQYAANHNARALKGVTSKILGVVLYDARANTFNAALMRGVYDAATPRGYSVIVCDGGASVE